VETAVHMLDLKIMTRMTQTSLTNSVVNVDIQFCGKVGKV